MPDAPLTKLHDVLLADVYLSMAAAHSSRTFAWVMDGDDDNCPIEAITWQRLLSDARLAASHLLSSGLNKKEHGQPELGPVGFLLDSNYSFYVYQVATWLLDRSVVLLSPRNSTASIEYLLQACGAQDLLVDDRHMHFAEEIKPRILGLNTVSITYTYPAGLRPYVRPSPTAEEVAADSDRPALYLHSSGSTGNPKLIPASHRHVLISMRAGLGCPYIGDTLYGPLPLSHGLGYCMYTLYPLGSGMIPVFLSSKFPLSAESVVRHLERLPRCIAFLPPAILEDLVNIGESAIRILARQTKRTIYAGAPLRKSCGQTLVNHGVQLITGYGMSELATVAVMNIASHNLKDDWMYIRFHDCYKTHFIPVDGESNTYELVASAGSFATPIVINHDSPQGFATGDLWTPHPAISGLWRHTGRKDSMIALSNGLKANTKEIENMLLEDTLISQLLVFGAGRFLIGVIVVPTRWEQTEKQFVEAIWPTIERINATVPTHMRLLRSMVLVASPSKPFATTDKNSVKFKETLALYADEIDFAYSNLGTAGSFEGQAQTFRRADVLPFIRGVVQQVTGQEISDDANFFEYGVDSLQAIRIWSRLQSITISFTPDLDGGASFSTSAIYRNPTISKLASFVLAQVTGAGQDSEDPRERINALVDLYSSDLRGYTSDSVPGSTQEHGRHVFLVTGTTGALGSQLLGHLMRRTDVTKIFCLNRPSTLSVVQRQSDSLEQYGTPYSVQDKVDSGRVVFADVAMAEENLGLSSLLLNEIRLTVTHVIHNAWQLNFNLALDNFTAHIAGVRNLINLSLSSYRSSPPSFIFISSIGAVSNYPGVIPEAPLDDPAVVVGQTGYSQSKYVAERIIDRAARIAGLPAFVIRCGQLSGSTVNGAWNPQEFIPILLRSSFEFGTIPEHFPDLRWIPVDIASEIVVNLSIQGTVGSQASSATYWHLENPEATAWSEIVERVTACGRGVRPVSTTEWLESLTRLSSSANVEQQLPAAAILVDFYRQYATGLDGRERTKLDTTNTVRACPRLGSVGDATQWIVKYIQCVISNM